MFKAFRVPEAAPLTILPADEVTLDKPSEAFDEVADAVSFAFVAASEVVEACLRLFLRMRNRDWRRTAREDMVAVISTEAPGGAVERYRGLFRTTLASE